MSFLFAALVAVIHVYVFFLESVLWARPRTNKLFRVSPADAATLKKFAFNQGFYNLFLAVAILFGISLRFGGHFVEGDVLIAYGTISVFCAGVVLFVSDPSLKKPALLQALPALGYLGLRLLGY